MALRHDTNHIQQAFLAWFTDSKQLFTTPLIISKQTKQSIELAFTDANSMISATLTSREINVKFNRNGGLGDSLIYFETMPELYRDYYVCSLRYPEDETFYASLEVLWELRLFEPFLMWVNNTLTQMPWIEVFEQENLPLVKLVESPPVDHHLMASQSIITANPLYKEVTINPH